MNDYKLGDSMRLMWLYLLTFIIAVVLDVYLIWAWRRYRRLRQALNADTEPFSKRRFFMMSLFPDVLSKWFDQFLQKDDIRRKLAVFLELFLIAAWAMWMGREYLDFDPFIVPAGREFGSAIQTHHLWTRFLDCGWCAVWNGFERGGYPAFADPHGSMLHPLVIITTLMFGVVNGAKVALVASFWFAGVAQWWLARELRLGWLPRLWSAAMAIVGGHLSGRMELGVFGVVLSTAMCSLVFAGIIHLTRRGSRRSVVVLSIMAASAILAGQGYIQIGLLGALPAVLILVWDGSGKLHLVWKQYLMVALLAILLAAPFLVPFVHLSPNFVKDQDAEFKSAQPLKYLPLNLIIDDWDYYKSEVLDKYPYPHLYSLYIGWVPVILAVVGLTLGKKDDRRWLWFFVSTILIEFLLGSAVLLKWLVKILPGVAGVRHPPQIAGLAVPLILGLSAYGLQRLLDFEWPDFWLGTQNESQAWRWGFSTQWLLLIPLLLSLKSGYEYSQFWVYMEERGEEIWQLLDELKTESLQWVNPPFGEHFYVEPALGERLKLSPGIMTWRWKDREFPVPYLEASYAGEPVGSPEFVGEAADIDIYARYDQPYAAVFYDDGFEPCQAEGMGGQLAVVCDVAIPGRLIVKENKWSGWKAWMDGERVTLTRSQWLAVDVPVGQHNFVFRYLPWDVPLGMAISVVGLVLCGWLWFVPSNENDLVE
ncbi:MAG: hypothetical protein H8D34_01160 [Chloroflexi bacterium]|nr:hypothetical protein [Chloroflexota bacterium]MBL7162188.1 hypothetical protein [Anaerolineales bacterium]